MYQGLYEFWELLFSGRCSAGLNFHLTQLCSLKTCAPTICFLFPKLPFLFSSGSPFSAVWHGHPGKSFLSLPSPSLMRTGRSFPISAFYRNLENWPLLLFPPPIFSKKVFSLNLLTPPHWGWRGVNRQQSGGPDGVWVVVGMCLINIS